MDGYNLSSDVPHSEKPTVSLEENCVLQGTDNITVIKVVIGSLQRAHHPSFNLMIVKEVVACVFSCFFFIPRVKLLLRLLLWQRGEGDNGEASDFHRVAIFRIC